MIGRQYEIENARKVCFMRTSRLKLFGPVFAAAGLLAACGSQNRTIGDIRAIEFGKINGIEIQTTEQVENHRACEDYRISGGNQVPDIVNRLKVAATIEKMKTPFPVGDGVISLTSEGVPQYAFRYYLDQERLLDLHKGILYQMPDDLSALLHDLDSLPLVNECGPSAY